MTAVQDAVGLATARTLLFVPGDRPERFATAAAARPDVVVLDLEDAVRAGSKARARDHVARWLRAGNRACVRLNAAGTSWHDRDLASLRGAGGLAGVLLPMADDPDVATAVHRSLGVPVLAIVETARGVVRAADIAAARGVVRLAFGALDLAADIEAEDPASFAVVRTQLVIASRAAGLEGPVDSVTTDVIDPDRAGREARAGRALGMRGKLCIHPRQIEPVAAAFTPDAEECDWARRVLAAGRSGGVAVVDGTMIDEPVLVRARRILARAEGGRA